MLTSLGSMPGTNKGSFDDLEYFNKTDARDITWAHAVNSQDKLNEFLNTNILMFEADVIMRFNRNDTEPVMAHPPENNSDLTLETFLKTVKPTKKGIKLDFKSILPVQLSMDLLKNIFGVTPLKPLWLNADILSGPGTTSELSQPVDAEDFIHTCTQMFPSATLSLGWTTAWSKEIASEGYTQSMADEMENICRNTTQVITFPLRAVYVKRSWEPLRGLLESSDRYTLTVWSSVGDEVDVQDLVWLIGQVDKMRLYMDLPPELDAELEKDLASNAGYASREITYIACILVAFLSFLIVEFV